MTMEFDDPESTPERKASAATSQSSAGRSQWRSLQDFTADLQRDSLFSQDYVVLTVAAALIATLGLRANSVATIIGAMIVAPLGVPLRSCALGLVTGDLKMVSNALRSILGGAVIAVGIAWLLALSLADPRSGSEIAARTVSTLNDLGVAVFAGAISGYAMLRRGVADALAGVAIAVALMPPLCVVGLMAAVGNWHASFGALFLYVTNVLGIIFACMVVFYVTGFARRSFREVGGAWALSITLLIALLVPLAFAWVRTTDAHNVENAADRYVSDYLRATPGVRIVDSSSDWTTKPLTFHVVLRADHPISVRSATILQQRLSAALHRDVHLVVDVVPMSEIDVGGDAPASMPVQK